MDDTKITDLILEIHKELSPEGRVKLDELITEIIGGLDKIATIIKN